MTLDYKEFLQLKAELYTVTRSIEGKRNTRFQHWRLRRKLQKILKKYRQEVRVTVFADGDRLRVDTDPPIAVVVPAPCDRIEVTFTVTKADHENS